MNKDFDQTMVKMRSDLLEQLPTRIAELRKLSCQIDSNGWEAESYLKLQRMVQGLARLTETFSLSQISLAAHHLEKQFVAIDEAEQFTVELNDSLKQALTALDETLQSEVKREAEILPAPFELNNVETSPLVFVIEGDSKHAQQLTVSLQRRNYQVRHFLSLRDFKSAVAQEGEPAALILNMSDISEWRHAIEVIRATCNHSLPVLLMSEHGDVDTRLAAYRSGATRYLVIPFASDKLTNLLDRLTLRAPKQPYRVLMVDDDPVMLEIQSGILKDAGMDVRTITKPLDALNEMYSFNPEVIVLDIYMPDVNGSELATLIREDESLISLPIIFLSAETDIDRQLLALNHGGDHFLTKPVEPSYLITAVITRARKYREVSQLEHSRQKISYELEREHLALNYHSIVSTTDLKGNITYVNKLFCDVSGYERNELLGKNHRIIKSDRHSPEFYQQMWQTIASGEVWQGEICNQTKGGEEYWVASTIIPFKDEHGKIYQYTSIRTDITATKNLEIKYKGLAERLRRSQIFANIGTWDWNIITGELFWSERIATLFGYSDGELETSYEDFINAVHPDDRELVSSAVNACVENGTEYDIEHRVVWPDGSIYWVQERGDVIRDSDGNALHMLGVVIDIHERMMAEDARRESEEKYRLQFELSEEPMWIIAGDRFVMANKAAAHTLGYENVDALIDTHPSEISPEYQDDGQSSFDKATEMMSVAYRKGYHRFEWLHKKISGEELYVEVSLTRVPHRGKDSLFCVWRDITERKKAEVVLLERQQQLEIAKEMSEKANQAKSDFLSSMSHELRTPMNAILGFAQILEYDDNLSEDNEDSVHEIIKAGNHLLELINEVLDLAKVESGRVDLSLEPVAVNTVVDDCFNLISTVASNRNINLSHQRTDGFVVRADYTRLKQVLLNLISNAIKYNRDGGSVKLEIEVKDNNQLRLLVIDTGSGIPQDRQAELFQPFNRLDAEGSEIEGTGIGLIITRRIVELMGGTVDFYSEVGVGSTFWIELPLESMPRSDNLDNSASAYKENREQSLQESEHLVLYIEDNPANLKLVTQLLGRRKHIHLLTAHTSSLGVELAMSRHPELILLDINLPEMDGYQVLELLKGDEATRQIPVVAITAKAMPKDVERGEDAGFDEYLTKPLDIDKFYNVIDSILGLVS